MQEQDARGGEDRLERILPREGRVLLLSRQLSERKAALLASTVPYLRLLAVAQYADRATARNRPGLIICAIEEGYTVPPATLGPNEDALIEELRLREEAQRAAVATPKPSPFRPGESLVDAIRRVRTEKGFELPKWLPNETRTP